MNEPFSADEFLDAYHNNDKRLRNYLHVMEKEWRPYITSQVIAMNGSEQDADDIYHEGIYELVANLGAGNFKGKSTLRTYFTTICKYKWMGRIRKDSRREEIRKEVLPPDGVSDSSDAFIAYEELGNILSDLLSRLGEKCNQILTLWGQGLSYDEIVQKIDTVNTGTARKRKHDCIQKLIEMIDEKPALREQLREFLTA